MKFKKYSYVQHVKTGGVYQIEDTPDTNMLEAGCVPAYGYREAFGLQKFQRRQTLMEDGRFVRFDMKAALRKACRKATTVTVTRRRRKE